MTDPVDLLDPELREAALTMRAMTAQYTPMTRRKLARRRKWMAENAQPPLADVPFSAGVVSRPRACGEGPEVQVYIVNAQPGQSRPGILHMHGGGFTASSALHGLRSVQALAATLDCPVVSVEYRLAPETIWSGSLEDNYAALLWMHGHAAELGVDPARIALMGESAGGGHAALLAIAARDRCEVRVAFQCLTYPMLDDRSGTSRKLADHIGYFGWNGEANRFGWKAFLGCSPGGRKVPSEAVPARCADLSGLPPAWIGVGGLDLFVEEDIDYAMRLNRSGVPAELLVVPGAFHGFDMFVGDAAVSRRFAAARLDALRRGLGDIAPMPAGRVL
jgi:acetyl esterase/lipase